MSAANYYQPHVYLNGILLNEAAPAWGVTAVANFSIKWGAADWFENVDPAVLTMTIHDPAGELLGTAQGQQILITRDPNDTIVFFGTVDEFDSEYVTIHDPEIGENRQMWAHVVKAYDPLGAMMRDRRRGPVYRDPRATVHNFHWGNCYMVDRKNDLNSRTPVPISWTPSMIDFTDAYKNSSQFVLFPPIVGYELSETVSLLTVLRNTVRAIGAFTRPYYDPALNRIFLLGDSRLGAGRLQNRADASSIELVELTNTSSGDVLILPGSQFVQNDGVRTSSGAKEQATRAEYNIAMPQLQKDESGRIKTQTTAMPVAVEAMPRAGSQLTITIDSDICYEFLQDEIGEGAAKVTVEQLLVLSARNPLQRNFGLTKLAPLEYRFDKHAAAPEWAIPFLSPTPARTGINGSEIQPYRLLESLTNLLPNISTFGIVGGTLSYTHKGGWRALLNPAHHGQPTGTPPTLGDVASSAQLGNVIGGSLVADWHHLQTAN